MVRIPAPQDESELFARAKALAGSSLSELARTHGIAVPDDLRRAKGFPGRLLEQALGATAASHALPDFPELGIELKTVPVLSTGRPCESTFVCRVALAEIGDVEWSRSRVRLKLGRVLWIPVEGDRRIPVGDRRIGMPLLWSPSQEEEATLRFDWEELAGLIGRGEVDAIHGRLGRYLQIRPKAANARARGRATDADGARCETLPRGFYLRAGFTERILRSNYVLG